MEERYLSAEGLCRYKDGQMTELPQRGGSKDYSPDGTWIQDKRLQLYSQQYREILTEERVKKLGHLVKGEWKPELEKVEIVGRPSKFIMTCGHAEKGRFFLHPEEAVSMLEKGDLEIYYGGLPMSVQEAYGTVLADRLPVENYQVYNHLTRLGYIVFRHKHTVPMTDYERKLGLSKHTRARKRKRKNSQSVSPEKKMTLVEDGWDEHPTNSDESMCEQSDPVLDSDNITDSCRQSDPPQSCDETTVSRTPGLPEHLAPERSYVHHLKEWTLSDRIDTDITGLSEGQRCPALCDFSDIRVPHLLEDLPNDFPKPDQRYLPPGVSVIVDNYAAVMRRYRPTMSAPCELDSTLTFSYPETRSRIQTASWVEYKKLSTDLSRQLSSPAAHLWTEGEVHPLIEPSESMTTEDVMEAISIIPSMNFAENMPRSARSLPPTNLVYDVYKPDSNFSKNAPGQPLFRLCVPREQDAAPDLCDLMTLCCRDVEVQWALVDGGDVMFYSFHGVRLPADVLY